MSTTASSTPIPVISVEGRRVLITGGSAGIGFGIAQALVENGALVLITGRREDRVVSSTAALNKAAARGGRAVGVVGDVTKKADNQRVIADVVREFGGLDVLINNAGWGKFTPLDAVEEEELRSTYELNVFSIYLLTQLALPELRKSSAGRIISIASVAGHRGFPFSTVYAATKAAVSAFGRALAIELASDEATRHITVNTISPGPFVTELFETLPEELSAGFLASVPLKRGGNTRVEIGGQVLVLASAAGGFITGQDIVIDGGLITHA